MSLNLNALKKRIDALERAMAKWCGAPNLVLSDEEYAAFGLSSAPLFATHDPEYAALAASFMRAYDKTRPPRQVDPAEMEAAMRLTVHGDEEEKAAAHHRYRLLMNAVFDRCGFDYAPRTTAL